MSKENVEIEKLDLDSMNIAENKRDELLRLFPEIRTEGGKIDFDKLKMTLGEQVDAGKERYVMNWPGKADSFKAVQSRSAGTLRPSPGCGVNAETSRNLFIEGDNLEVLKLLQKGYLNKIKLIYIDPPYNTGSDFIYPDNYTENLRTYLLYTKQIDDEGYKFSSNRDTDGRFHSKWMNMLYPRLYLARNLLREDGLIFVSIDENEVDNLKKMLIEIFGEENFIGTIANTNNPKGRSDDKFIATAHEYLLVAAKDRTAARMYGFEPDEKITKRYNKVDSEGENYREIDLRKTGDADRRVDRPDMFYYFYYDEKLDSLRIFKEQDKAETNEVEIIPLKDDGSEGRWRWGFNTARENLDKLNAKYMPNRKVFGIFERDYLKGRDPVKPTSSWTFKDVNSERGSEQLIDLGFDKEVFPHPKPLGTMRRILEIGTIPEEDSIVMDFFAGSCSLFHAALELNLSGERRIQTILVQLPEKLDLDKSEQRPGHKFCLDNGLKPNIAEIAKERMRRSIKAVSESDDNGECDLGFRVFKLDSSNFKSWGQKMDSRETLEQQLELHVDHLKKGRVSEDILYEILMKSGFSLTVDVEVKSFQEKTIYSIAGGLFLICLEGELTLDLIKHIAEEKPERIVFLDRSFGNNDQLKANAIQILKTKGVSSFKTV